MTVDRWKDDEQLLADLAEAVRATDPTTGRIRAIGDQVPLGRALDLEFELAELAYDSALDPALVARDGGSAEYRTMLFDAQTGQVQIEAVGRQVIGQVMPARGGTIAVETRDGTVARADIDETGCFSVPAVPAGPVRFRWGAVATDWVRLW
jgi:hypothetical protein